MAKVRTAGILVGGKGERLKSLFPDIPKPLVPIAGRPFLDHLLTSLAPYQFQDVVLLTGYRSDLFENYLSRSREFGFRIHLSVESMPLGSGGALRNSKILASEPEFLVFNGDTYFEGSLEPLIEAPLDGSLGGIGLLEVTKADRFGTVILNQDRTIREFREKVPGTSGLVNMGVWKLTDRLVQKVAVDRFFSLEKELFAVHPLCFQGIRLSGTFTDIGIPEDYQAFNQKMFRRHA